MLHEEESGQAGVAREGVLVLHALHREGSGCVHCTGRGPTAHVLHEEGSRHLYIAWRGGGGRWCCMCCTRRGPGARIAQGGIWLRMYCMGRGPSMCALHKEGSWRVCVAWREVLVLRVLHGEGSWSMCVA